MDRIKTDWENTVSQRLGLLVASQGESAEWINVMMQTVWRPIVCPLVEKVLPPIVNAELKAILLDKTVAMPVPSFVKGMEMLSINMGSAAPRLTQCDVIAHKGVLPDGDVCIEMSTELMSNDLLCEMRIIVEGIAIPSVKLLVNVDAVKFTGRLGARIRPSAKAVTVGFLEGPSVKLGIKLRTRLGTESVLHEVVHGLNERSRKRLGRGFSVTDVPGIRKILENLIKSEIAKRLVFPRAIAVPLDLDDVVVYGAPDTIPREDQGPIIGGVMYLTLVEMRGVPLSIPGQRTSKRLFGLPRPLSAMGVAPIAVPTVTARAWISTEAHTEGLQHVVTEHVYTDEGIMRNSDASVTDAKAQPGVSGTDESAKLFLKIIAARNLKAKDFGGTSDPYCVITCNKEEFRTRTSYKTVNPTWHGENFVFQQTPLNNSVIEINIWDEDRWQLSNDFLGKVEIPVSDVYVRSTLDRTPPASKWYNLQHRNPKKKVRGQLQVIVFIDRLEMDKKAEEEDLLVQLGGRRLTEEEEKRKEKEELRRQRRQNSMSSSGPSGVGGKPSLSLARSSGITPTVMENSVPPRLFVHVASGTSFPKLLGVKYSAEVVIGGTLLSSATIRPYDDGTTQFDTLFEANVPENFCSEALRFYEVKVNIFSHNDPHSHYNKNKKKGDAYNEEEELALMDTGTRVKYGSVWLPFTSQIIYPVTESQAIGEEATTLLFRRPLDLANRVYSPWARIVWGIPPRVDRTPPAMFFKDGSPHWGNARPRKLKITHQMDFVNLKLQCHKYGHDLGECQINLTRTAAKGTLYNFPDFNGIPTLIRSRHGEEVECWIPIEGSQSHELKVRLRTDWFSSNADLNEALGVSDHLTEKPQHQNVAPKLNDEQYLREMAAIKVQRTFRRLRTQRVMTVKEDTALMVTLVEISGANRNAYLWVAKFGFGGVTQQLVGRRDSYTAGCMPSCFMNETQVGT